MRYSTAYSQQKNRCSNCGHRLVMIDNRKYCQVVTGSEQDNTVWVVCPCKSHKNLRS